MISELEIQKYDQMFGTRSKYFPYSNIIMIETPLDSWKIQVTNRKIKPVCLLHKNKFGRKNKYHIQAYKSELYHAYHSIYTHKNWMPIINKCNEGTNK